jgi:hypothetical protein
MGEDRGTGPTFGVDGGAIEIVLSGGSRVIVGKRADMTALREVIAILEAR